MQQTANYSLSKPEKTDSVSIDVLNENMDKVDAALRELSQETAASIHGSGHAAGGADPITPDMIGAADNALSNLPYPAAALANLGAAGGRNLLDNWYFADPIDQRQGYVIPPDTPYYSDTALITQAGTVSAYTKASKVNDTYGTIIVSGATYYVAWSAAVRGYVGAGYTVDRWVSTNGAGILRVYDDCVEFSASGGTAYFIQLIEPALTATLRGRKVTASVYADGEVLAGSAIFPQVPGSGHAHENLISGLGYSVNMEVWSTGGDRIVITVNSGYSVRMKAIKLELGDTQTLAHRDEDGNWVLNGPPHNKAAELLKCCMNAADASDAYANNKVTPAAMGAAAMEVVSYVGTGLHGAANPCQATFSFAPKLVLGLFAVGSSGGMSFFPSSTNYNDYSVSVDWAMLPERMTTQWQSGAGLGKSASWGSYWLKQYGKKSADGKTLYWYQDDAGLGDSEGASFQLNTANTTYYLIAFA